mmetsp:Transcript_60442/g.141537  ORF Transcript_60442/g.141537 Transcript_60442/m.141537 type:complete len:202 (+) Transcript_60442:907-1512(+)
MRSLQFLMTSSKCSAPISMRTAFLLLWYVMSSGTTAIALSYISRASLNCFFLYNSLPLVFQSSASFCSGVLRSSGGASSFFGSSFFLGAGEGSGLSKSSPLMVLTSMPCMAMKSSSTLLSWFIICMIICCCMFPGSEASICTFCISSWSCMYSLILGFLTAAAVRAAGSNCRPPPPPPAPAPAPGTSYLASMAFFKPSFKV